MQKKPITGGDAVYMEQRVERKYASIRSSRKCTIGWFCAVVAINIGNKLFLDKR